MKEKLLNLIRMKLVYSFQNVAVKEISNGNNVTKITVGVLKENLERKCSQQG